MKISSFIGIILIGASLLLSFNVFSAGKTTKFTFKNQGMEREYFLYIPDGLKNNAPLVFVLHGYGGSAESHGYGMDAVADKNSFAVCYPQGSLDDKNTPSWNVGYPSQKNMKVDDVKFLRDLAKYLQKQFNLSKENTFLTGLSNGGEMCYLLAYCNQTVFKAVAPIAGLTMRWIYEEMKPKRAIPLFEVHGTQDRVSEWYGDLDNKYGWGEYMPVPIAVNYWVGQNKCLTLVTDTVASVSNNPDHTVIRHKYKDGKNGSQVWLYEIVNGGHSWCDGDVNTSEEIWSFFSCFLK
ncbi:MAG: PHB depolymerase family esterase [Bacteroidales bacterium]|nr:PHB depolymerase family esterase [Bacteroidales bacterium]